MGPAGSWTASGAAGTRTSAPPRLLPADPRAGRGCVPQLLATTRTLRALGGHQPRVLLARQTTGMAGTPRCLHRAPDVLAELGVRWGQDRELLPALSPVCPASRSGHTHALRAKIEGKLGSPNWVIPTSGPLYWPIGVSLPWPAFLGVLPARDQARPSVQRPDGGALVESSHLPFPTPAGTTSPVQSLAPHLGSNKCLLGWTEASTNIYLYLYIYVYAQAGSCQASRAAGIQTHAPVGWHQPGPSLREQDESGAEPAL